jgi:hypothetical protein
LVSDELERIWKESVVAYLRYYPSIFLERQRKPTKILRLAYIPSEIPVEHLANTSLGRCRLANLLVVIYVKRKF